MKTDRIRTDTNSNISNILPFPSSSSSAGGGSFCGFASPRPPSCPPRSNSSYSAAWPWPRPHPPRYACCKLRLRGTSMSASSRSAEHTVRSRVCHFHHRLPFPRNVMRNAQVNRRLLRAHPFGSGRGRAEGDD